MDTPDNRRLYAKLVARAWTDNAFKADLLGDPGTTVRTNGMALPKDAVVTVVESGKGFVADETATPPTLELLLPPRPADLTDESILSYQSDAYIGSQGFSCSSSYS